MADLSSCLIVALGYLCSLSRFSLDNGLLGVVQVLNCSDALHLLKSLADLILAERVRMGLVLSSASYEVRAEVVVIDLRSLANKLAEKGLLTGRGTEVGPGERLSEGNGCALVRTESEHD